MPNQNANYVIKSHTDKVKQDQIDALPLTVKNAYKAYEDHLENEPEKHSGEYPNWKKTNDKLYNKYKDLCKKHLLDHSKTAYLLVQL